MEEYKNFTKPLTAYTIFGYVLPGFFFISLLVFDFSFSNVEEMLEPDIAANYQIAVDISIQLLNLFKPHAQYQFAFISLVLFIFFCYFLGHIISAVSSFFIERILVYNTLGYPAENLLLTIERVQLPVWFGKFRTPFESETTAKIKSEVRNQFGFCVPVKDYYWLLYSYIMTVKPHLGPRIQHFVNLAGFSRNLTGVFLLYVLLRFFIISRFFGLEFNCNSVALILLYLLIAVFLFWNYLKFYKRQALDIYFLFLSIQSEKYKSNSNVSESMPILGDEVVAEVGEG
jgi:hypothetical protein